jgi:uncharacterized protein
LSSDGIDYQRFLEDALRDAVRRLLAEVAEHGLPGEHYFYIGFLTGHPGVAMPSLLRDLYPNEMTIRLQYQYWDLDVQPDSFSVELSFSGSRHRLSIPFAALTTFADPSAEFAWRFQPRSPLQSAPPLRPQDPQDPQEVEDGQGAAAAPPAPPTEGGDAQPGKAARPGLVIAPLAAPAAAAAPPATAADPPSDPPGAAAAPPPAKDRARSQPGEVIRFDPSRRR